MEQFSNLTDEHCAFIAKQHVFFTASAAANSRINLSPKGLDALRVVDKSTVAYLDLTGSGNETAAHARADGRLTVMLCAFEGPPLIMRLYGHSRILPRAGEAYTALLRDYFDNQEPIGARQIVVLDIEMVQTSCGYGVPAYQYKRERPSLITWAAKKGEAGLREYRRKKNAVSIDGIPTGHVEE